MELSIVDVWNYKIDETKGIILHNNITDIKLYSIKKFSLMPRYHQIIYFRDLINKSLLFGSICKIKLFLELMYYIYYLLYFTKFYNDKIYNDKLFYNTIIIKLEMFIKNDYFKHRKIYYKDMKILKNIYYVFEKKYICEYKECLKDCSDKQHIYCNIHLRNINKNSKFLREITNLPLDICKIIYEYSL
jgi:hypothetical protein